jgi:ADP-ribose pyrophosphatase
MHEIGRERHYVGRAFDVYRVEIRMPDKQEGLYDLVVHPGAVVILAVDKEDLIFVRQHRIGAGIPLLELPAGVLNKNEPPEDCAFREIREETGMAARSLQKLGAFYSTPGYCTEFQHVFLATGLFDDPLEPDTDEFIELVRIPIDNAYQMALDGEIQDGKTLAAMLLAKPHLFP